MLRLDKGEKKLHRLEARKMADVGLLEYHDVQQMIRHSASDFFDELDEKLVLIGEEVRPATFVDDRIDLLAVDPQGTAVVIELKRGTNKLQLLQALAYAGMVAKWKGEQLIQHLANSSNTTQEEAREELEQFLEEDTSSLNQSQRVILLAEDFDYEVLVRLHGVEPRAARSLRFGPTGRRQLTKSKIQRFLTSSDRRSRRGERVT